jgi:hypothetical protein
MPDRAWYEDLRFVFQDTFGELEGGYLPEPFYAALTDSIGSKPEIDLIHPVEDDDGQALLFVQGDRAYIVRYEPRDTTEFRFLGKLKGGRYTERVKVPEKGLDITMEFEHRRLGEGKALRTSLAQEMHVPGALLSDKTTRAIERGRKLRETFRRWSMDGCLGADRPRQRPALAPQAAPGRDSAAARP